jgi:hypothetical protein
VVHGHGERRPKGPIAVAEGYEERTGRSRKSQENYIDLAVAIEVSGHTKESQVGRSVERANIGSYGGTKSTIGLSERNFNHSIGILLINANEVRLAVVVQVHDRSSIEKEQGKSLGSLELTHPIGNSENYYKDNCSYASLQDKLSQGMTNDVVV